jgi:hypothetical protein
LRAINGNAQKSLGKDHHIVRFEAVLKIGKSDDLTILFIKDFFYYPSVQHVDTLIYLSISKTEQIYRTK